MHIEVVFYVLLIDLLGIISPGPDFFIVLKNSLTNSHKAGIFTGIGIAFGSFLVFALVLLGVGIIVANNKWLMLAVKTIGALYLAYLALKSLFMSTKIIEPDLSANVVFNKHTGLFKEFFSSGLLCNLTNPQSLLFFMSLSAYAVIHGATQVVDIITMIVISTLNTALWFSLVAMIFGNVKIRNIFYKKQRIIHIAFAFMLFYVVFEIVKL